jgi:hypothetical protein
MLTTSLAAYISSALKRLSLSCLCIVQILKRIAIRIARIFILFSSVSDCREGATLDIRGMDIVSRKISQLGEFHSAWLMAFRQSADWLSHYRHQSE